MAWSEQRAVGIFAHHDGGDVPLGAGALVTPGLVLTARGVVTSGASLVVCTRDGRAHPATHLPWRLGDLDVALLSLARPLDLRLAHPLLLLADRPLAAHDPWEADGYLYTMNGALVDPWRKVGGRARSYAPGGERLSLDVTTKLSAGDGLPGAAVVVGHQVVGVVGSGVMESAGDTLTATPVGRFLGDAAFREALGISAADAAFERRVLTTVTKARSLLAEHAPLREVLAAHLATDGDVAAELVRRRSVCDLAGALDAADLALAARGELPARRALREILTHVLPYAADRETVVSACADALQRGERSFDLPLSTEMAAEAVFAGVDERPCLFTDTAAEYPFGVSLYRVPGAAEEYLHPPAGDDPDGGRASVLVVQELADRLGIQSSLRATHKLRCVAVEAELRRRARTASLSRDPPLYVLLDDTEGGARGGSLWAVMVGTLGRDVKSLRFVRLTGGDPVEEYTAASHVREIRERKV